MPAFKLGNVDFGSPPLTSPNKAVYSYTWELNNLPFDPGGIADIGFSLQLALGNRQIYLKDCLLPNFSFIEEKYKGPSLEYKYASEITWDDVALTFYDTHGLINVLHFLSKKTWDQEKGIRPANEYKFTSIIKVFQADGDVEAQYNLHGSWIKQINQSRLTYETSDMHQIAVVLSYDWATYQTVR